MHKLGRNRRDHARFALTIEDYLRPHPVTGGLEKVADSEDVDRASRVMAWPMYGNDQIGDCTIAAMGHAFTALEMYAFRPSSIFSGAEIVKAYSAVSGYDPGTGANDNGAQMQDVLAYMRTEGMTDEMGRVHKVVAYAALGKPSSPALLSRCLKTFGSVYVGFACPQSAEDQFGREPWTYEPGSPILGGHAISLHRRHPYSSKKGVWDFSTWGSLQAVTSPFLAHYVEEAWIFVTEDWIESNGSTADGLSLAQLTSDMRFI
jgi:hypothetical protein